MLGADLMEEFRVRHAVAQRIWVSNPPTRVNCEIPRRSTIVTGIHQGRRGLAESVDRWIAGRLSATERKEWKTSEGSCPLRKKEFPRISTV